MTQRPERRLRPYVPVAASIVLLGLLTVFISVVSGRWTEEFNVSGFIRTGNWRTPSLTPNGMDTALDADETALGFFENGRFGVSGTVLVENGGLHATRGLEIISTIKTNTGKGQYSDYLRSAVDVSAMPILAAGQKYLYAYKINFDPIPGAQYLHHVKVTITNYTGWLPGDHNCPGLALCPFGQDKEVIFVLPVTPFSPTSTFTTRTTPTVQLVVPVPSGLTFTPVPPAPALNATVVVSATPDPTGTVAVAPTKTATATLTPQVTPSPQLTSTPLNTPTSTATLTATVTLTTTVSPSVTVTPHVTNPQGTPVLTPTETPTPTPTLQATVAPLSTTTLISASATPTSSTGSTNPTK